MPPRDLTGSLDKRRRDEADLRPATVVRPAGPGQWVAQLPGSEQEITVGSSAGRRSWAPGSQVVLGSYSGGPEGLTIIGDPPPGQLGGAKFPQQTIPAGPTGKPGTYIGIFADFGELELAAWSYRDGTYVRELGRLAFDPDAVAHVSLIAADSAGLAQPGSLVFSEVVALESAGLHVWDIKADAIFDLATGAGTHFSSAAYIGGWLYWCAYPSEPSAEATPVYLMRARADFSDLGAVGVHTIDGISEQLGGLEVGWSPGAVTALTEAGCTVFLEWQADLGAHTGTVAIRFGLTGGSTEHPDPSSFEAVRGIPVSTQSLRADPATLSGELLRADTSSAQYQPLWTGLPTLASSSAVRGEIAVYGSVGSERVLWRGPAAVGGSPTIKFPVQPGPGDEVPTWFFAAG